MKKLFLIATAAVALIFSAPASAQTGSWTKVAGFNVSVNELEHDFGTKPLYTKTEFEFQIKNDSAETLVIKNITTSCGCTTPTYSKRPVKSGKTAVVKVAYDSARIGVFDKTVYVYTNFSNEPIELKIKGTMEETKNKE